MKPKPTTGDIYHFHLDNQMPRIGSGFRIVELVSFGWKWVKVKTIHPDERLIFRQRVSRKIWRKCDGKRIIYACRREIL